MAVPAARRPGPGPDLPGARRRVLLPERQGHHRHRGGRLRHQRDQHRHATGSPTGTALRGCPARAPNHVSNPDDAMLLPGGDILSRRHQELPDPRWSGRPRTGPPGSSATPATAAGTTRPGTSGSPNGAFPMTNGKYLVTEINGSWVNALSACPATSPGRPTRRGSATRRTPTRSTPGCYLTADYSTPGQVVEFTASGPAAVAVRRAGPPVAGPAPAQRGHPGQRRLQRPGHRDRPGHQPDRLAVRPYRRRRAAGPATSTTRTAWT